MPTITPDRPPYNQLPHRIASDFRNKKIGRNELFLCLWLRAIANPYGIVTTSLDAIRDDIFPDLKKNTVNKILLSLLHKQCIYFQVRQGRRGSFEIHLGDLKLPKGKGYKTLERFFAHKPTADKQNSQADSAEVSQKLRDQGQKLTEVKGQLAQHFSATSGRQPFRSYQNETDTQKEIENHDTLGKKPFKGNVRTRDFEPRTTEQARCEEIALDIGAEYMDAMLAVLRLPNGLEILEEAWGFFREDRQKGKPIKDPPGYFYGIVKRVIRKKAEKV